MRSRIPLALLAVTVVAIQAAATLGGAEYYLTQIIMSAYYSLVAVGLCLLMGYAGQISLGHAAFFAIGGYTTAVLTTLDLLHYRDNPAIALLLRSGLTIASTNDYGAPIAYLSPWLALALALTISALVAFVIGIPVLRLRGHYLAMATLGFGTIVYRLVLGSHVFGEADGISEVPGFPLWGGLVFDGSRAHRVAAYYFTWLVVGTCVVLVLNLVNSRVGRALRAMHGNEEAAQAMGVNTARLKLGLFVFSAVLAALAGVMLTHYNGGIGPSEASVMKSVRYVAIVAVGGMANVWGTLTASMVLNFLSLRGYFGTFDDAVFGATLVTMMLFAPEGIVRRRIAARRAAAGSPGRAGVGVEGAAGDA